MALYQAKDSWLSPFKRARIGDSWKLGAQIRLTFTKCEFRKTRGIDYGREHFARCGLARERAAECDLRLWRQQIARRIAVGSLSAFSYAGHGVDLTRSYRIFSAANWGY